MGEIIGIDANAVTADETGAEGQEVPFRASGFENFEGIDADFFEDHSQLVHERNVEVALGVLDNFGGLGDFDGTCRIDTRRDD